MARSAARDVYARHLRKHDGDDRLVDLACEFVDGQTGELLWSVGGRWDVDEREWSAQEPETGLRFEMFGDQLEPARFFGAWFAHRLGGAPMSVEIYAALLLGGSRAGKTHLGIRLPIAAAVAIPGARIWVIAETELAFDECETELDETIPPGWARKRANMYLFANGARIVLRSGRSAHRLKRGRCDFAFVNEAQNMGQRVYDMLRMRTSDTGGIVVFAANPPNDNPEGEWVAQWADDVAVGKRGNTKVFGFDPRRNPMINQRQLEALRSETDWRTYQIEVLGRRLPPSNAVCHAFEAERNLATELDGEDVTAQLAKRQRLGPDVETVVGLDFQRAPHCCGVGLRAYEVAGVVRLHAVLEVIVEMGDELALSEAMLEAGLDPATTALVADASGDWQGVDRSHGNKARERSLTSHAILRAEGWRVYLPDRDRRGNPPVIERTKNANRLLCSADGTAFAYFDEERVPRLVEAIRKYRKKNGIPEKFSRYAHLFDAWSYPLYRLIPPVAKARRGPAIGTVKKTRPRSMRGY